MIFCFFLASCNEKEVTIAEAIEVKSDYKAKISTSAGEIFENEAFKPMPIFFNMGSVRISENKKVETIILSDKLSKGKTVDIKPIGLFRFNKDSVMNNFMISVPADSTKNVLDVYSFHDLSQKQYQIKFLIEDWFRGNCKLGKCSKFEWQSEVQALKLIE